MFIIVRAGSLIIRQNIIDKRLPVFYDLKGDWMTMRKCGGKRINAALNAFTFEVRDGTDGHTQLLPFLMVFI